MFYNETTLNLFMVIVRPFTAEQARAIASEIDPVESYLSRVYNAISLSASIGEYSAKFELPSQSQLWQRITTALIDSGFEAHVVHDIAEDTRHLEVRW